ncbi:class I adenylate-forming enzyme family protein [Bradyrhizobium sp. STM 3557]|uniref:class I adenylate-forming enzyme family protein n=1 Tax=Bradyrhizobium sp. STM 3557 TaxID=578920 RepID=UPI00388F9011
MTLTPNDALIQKAQARPQDTAFIFHDVVWTYQKLARETDRLARAMAAQGVGPGDRVAIHMMNRPEFVVAYHACFRLGAIAAPLRTAFTFAELGPILRRLEPALYLGEAGLYGNVAAVDAALLPASQRFVLGAAGDGGFQPWEALFTGSQDAVMFPPVADEPCVLITTSGTTGQPKFVTHTQATLAASVALTRDHWDLSERDVVAVPLALAHMSGLFCTVCFLQLGLPFILLEGFEADKVLDAMERHATTVHIGFPAQYAAMAEAQQKRQRNLGALRYSLTGGDTCPVALQEQVTSLFGAPLYNLWGASEVIGQLTFGLRPGQVMRVVPGAQVRIVDDAGNDVADGEVGEMLIAGDNLFVGYWNDDKATAAALRDGWYHTGDLVRRGEGDEIWFVARKKDIIIRGGTNISPIEIEEAIIAAHPAVAQAAVVGLPDEVLGQRVFAFATLAGTAAGDAVMPELVGRLSQRLAAYKMPEAIMVIDKMPRNALSKVDRQMLLAMAMQADRDQRSQAAPARLLPVTQAEAKSPRRSVASR